MNTPSCNETEARGLPLWLAGALLRRRDLAPRFVYWRQRLARQSRGWRRRLRRQLAVTVTSAALLLAMSGVSAQVEPAAPDNVITVVNGEWRVAENNKCSLGEAIRNANNQTTGLAHDDCAAGNPAGADTINLPTNGLFTMTTAFATSSTYGNTGLPWIHSTVTINGNGSTIRRGGSAPGFRILAVGEDGNLTLNNVTVSNGEATYTEDASAFYGGGGILNNGSLTIAGSTVSDNAVYGYCDYFSPKGGGILNHGTLVITSSRIADNTSGCQYGALAGGIFSSGSLTIIGSVVSGNHVGGNGASAAGIFSNGDLFVQQSSIIDNTLYTGDQGGEGGGIQTFGWAEVHNSLIAGNTLSSWYDNDPYLYGGGIANKGDLVVVNSTISGNESTNGAGISNRYTGSVVITNSTIVENEGSGIFATCEYYATTTALRRSIISGNGSMEVVLASWGNCPGGMTVNSHNIFGANGNPGTTGFTPGPTDIVPTVGLNAILSPLADNGGPTQTHALPAGSPALDRAPNNSCTAAPVNGLDQRAQPRNQNGSGSASSNECDVGAFERAGSATPVGAFYLSTAKAGTVGGVAFAPADIIKYDPVAGWSLYFDGSDVGITKNVTAFELQADGSILLSLVATQTVPGAGSVQPQDILRFTPTATGPNTAGTFQLWVDGSNVGLTTAAEKIDALGLAADGRIAISTTGAAAVAGPGGATLQAADEDALGFNRASATWSALLDFTALAGMGPEDVNALWINPTTGEVFVSLGSAFNLGGVAGDAKDIIKLTPNGGGYTPSLYWDGSAAGFPAIIDGLEIVN